MINRAFDDIVLNGPTLLKVEQNSILFVITCHNNVNSKALVNDIQKKINKMHPLYLKKSFKERFYVNIKSN